MKKIFVNHLNNLQDEKETRDMSETEPKKRGRKKKVVEENDPSNPIVKKDEPVKRSKKSGKIVNALALTEMIQAKNVNIILHLKCTMKQIEEHYQKLQKNQDPLTYLPEAPSEIQAFEEPTQTATYSILSEEPTKPAYTSVDTTNFVCPQCDFNSKYNSNSNANTKHGVDETNINHKLKEIKLQFYKNEVDKKSACFWCTYPFDNDTCYILSHGSMGDIQGYGSFCSPECSVAFLYNNLNWDDSMKMESYQLINHYYGKPNQYQDNIKPAASPFFFLEKFYGNMDIQEYRKLSKSNHMLLTVDKPVTRILPEIHEDSDKFIMQNNTQMRGNYKVKKQGDKSTLPDRNSILRDSFGLTAVN